jgi:hypothetical protein
VRSIKQAQELGFSLDEIGELLTTACELSRHADDAVCPALVKISGSEKKKKR